MQRDPWKITREMFLSETETETLLAFLRQREESSADSSARITAATDRVIVETLLYSGLRNSEFCQLRVRDTPVVQKVQAVNVCENSREHRQVYLPRPVVELLKRFVREIRPQLTPVGVSPTDRDQPLIFNERGKPYERTALYRRVVRILSQAGLADRASVQLLRHTYGYLAYQRTNGNLLFVQRQLGHAHPMVTAVYAEFVDFPGDQLANQIAVTSSAGRTRRRSSRSSAQ